jgi:hypothetical protein
MQEAKDESDTDPRVMADLSALADGSLDQKRAEAVSELIASSPELRERYEREQRAVSVLRQVHDDRAPHSLRLAIEARRHAAPRRRARLLSAGALVATVAATVALLVLLLPGGSPGAPSVSQAAELALRGPALPSPARASHVKLNKDVEEVYFPNWDWSHWRASGARTDRLRGRLAVTVYYTNTRDLRQIAYTILGAPPLRWPGSRMTYLHGIELQTLVRNGRLIITWRRSGHTCVLSGSGVTVAELAKLAGWKAPGL